MTPWALSIVLVAPVVGRLSDRYPASVLSTAGLCIAGLGFLLIRLVPVHPTDFDIIWPIVVAGVGFGVFQPPNNKAMSTTAPKLRTGSASGMISVARLLGQTVGGMLVALTLGLVLHGATATCLTLAFATAMVSAGISATRLKKERLGGAAP